MPFRLCFVVCFFFTAILRGQENPLPKMLVCPGVDWVLMSKIREDEPPFYLATIGPKGLPFDTLDPNFTYEFFSWRYQKVVLNFAQLEAL